MRGFLKMLLACIVAIGLVMAILFLMGVAVFKAASDATKPEVKSKTVLVLDLSKPVMEQHSEPGISLMEGKTPEINGLFDLVRAIRQATADSAVKGIYILCQGNAMGFASSNEVRNQLIAFKKSGKFVTAASDYISQRAYEVANMANDVYCQPGGMVDWRGYSFNLTFLKGALDKLEIQPEIFYAGQYKSATEPLRLTKMSEPNRHQLTEFIEDLYQRFLVNTAAARNKDTAYLRSLANQYTVRNAKDAADAGLINQTYYDDEVKDGLRKKLGLKPSDKIAFMDMADYIKNSNWDHTTGSDKIALIYAEGDIVDGKGSKNNIGGDKFRDLLRKARMDKNIKAVVLRVNSPGGSAVASETIWREVDLLKKEKPVVVSMGDYAASGGYYISCNADSIFAQPNTLTGSIGVFSLFFNATALFNNKLGITFDGVKTGAYADYPNTFRPMTEIEKKISQDGVDSIYSLFKRRVVNGRKLAQSVVDSVAQGRIWSGEKALGLGLVDKIGGIQDALDCAARMAKLKDYQLKEWPVVKEPALLQRILVSSGSDEEDDKETTANTTSLKEQLGDQTYDLFCQYKLLQSWIGKPQMRLPFFIGIQ